MSAKRMRLQGIHLYPVKSLQGISVGEAQVDHLGAAGDRRFLVVDGEGGFLTQRTLSVMATVGTVLTEGHVTLRSPGRRDLSVSRAADPQAPLVRVRIWKSEGLEAEDCGPEASAWLSGALGTPCRLVRVGASFHRPVKSGPGLQGDVHAFADAYPFLAVSEASLGDLNRRIRDSGAGPVPMDRFRPNLVLSGLDAFAEDTWKRVRIGEVVFRCAGPCARCIVTTTDQATGERGVEPLRTLAQFRRNPAEPSHVNFGQNLVHESKAGRLRVGDPVEVLE
jgi:uncharacterized protein YcbX